MATPLVQFARLLCATLCLCVLQVSAQNFPSKPLRLVVPFGPGGVGDITSRAVMQKVSESLGRQVIIDNRPSAGGIIAAEMVAKAEPDGYTMMLLNNTNAVSAAMFKKLPYDTVRDFAMVTTIGTFSIGVLVAAESPVKSVRDLIALVKAGDGKTNIGTINIGSTQYLAAELFKSMSGTESTTVPFNNTAAVISALRGGSVQVAFEFLPPVLGQIRAGTLRAVAVSSKTRFSPLPGVATLDESGLAGYDVASWNGIGVPAGTPRAIIDRLNREIHAAVNSPQVKQRFQELGVEPRLSTPEDMVKSVTAEIARWNALIDKTKIPRL